MNTNQISIIVCFYNANEKLVPTSECLMRLNTNGLEVELIFVDNNSNDDSDELLMKLFKDFKGFPMQIVQEKRPGLSHARLAGINASKYDTLLFCDDDNWLAEDYLQKGITVLNKNPQIGVLGGLGKAVSEVEFPSWFDEHLNYFAVGPQAAENGKVRGNRNVVYGAGMYVRKTYFILLQEKGFASYSLDRVGKELSSGGDSEMCLVFQVAGYDIWYDDSLTFKHYIEPSRLTIEYLNKLKKGMANSRFLIRFYLEYLNEYRPQVGTYFWVKELGYASKDLLLSVFSFNKQATIRSFVFVKYLLKERGKYNENVRSIIAFCEKLNPHTT